MCAWTVDISVSSRTGHLTLIITSPLVTKVEYKEVQT